MNPLSGIMQVVLFITVSMFFTVHEFQAGEISSAISTIIVLLMGVLLERLALAPIRKASQEYRKVHHVK